MLTGEKPKPEGFGEKISAICKGRTTSLKGRKRNPEFCEKISAAKKGKPRPDLAEFNRSRKGMPAPWTVESNKRRRKKDSNNEK